LKRLAFTHNSAWLLEKKVMSPLERRREELEDGKGGDHDILYQFTLPVSIHQVLAWMKLRVRVQDGVLQA
jgi:hypothetical protein